MRPVPRKRLEAECPARGNCTAASNHGEVAGRGADIDDEAFVKAPEQLPNNTVAKGGEDRSAGVDHGALIMHVVSLEGIAALQLYTALSRNPVSGWSSRGEVRHDCQGEVGYVRDRPMDQASIVGLPSTQSTAVSLQHQFSGKPCRICESPYIAYVRHIPMRRMRLANPIYYSAWNARAFCSRKYIWSQTISCSVMQPGISRWRNGIHHLGEPFLRRRSQEEPAHPVSPGDWVRNRHFPFHRRQARATCARARYQSLHAANQRWSAMAWLSTPVCGRTKRQKSTSIWSSASLLSSISPIRAR